MWLAVAAVVAGVLAGGLYGRVGSAAGPARRSGTGEGPGPARSWRWIWVGAVGLLLAGPGSRWLAGTSGLAVEAGGYAAMAAFTAANGRRSGMVLLTIGLLSNLVVVSVDGGMPVAGLPPGTSADGHHHGLTSADHLAVLADDVKVPLLSEQASAGDLLIALGAAVVAFGWVEPARADRRRRPAPKAGPAAGTH